MHPLTILYLSKRRNSTTLILTFFLTFGSAFGQITQNQDIITINLDQKFESRQILLSQLVDSVEIVPLESNVDSYIPKLTDVFISSNFIALSSGRDYPNYTSVKLFSRKGVFIRSIGKRGDGPGEYILPLNVCIDESESYIYVNDWVKGRLLLYSVDGQFLKSINIENFSPSKHFVLSLLKNNKIGAYFNRPAVPTDDFYSLIVFDSVLNVTNRVHHQKNDQNLLHNRGGWKFCQETTENLILWESFYDTIYYLNSTYEDIRKVCFNTGRKRITPEVRANRKIKIEKYYHPDMIRVLGNYIFFYLVYNGDAPLMYYNIKSNNNQAYLASEGFKCDTSYLAQYHLSFTNDLYDFEPVRAYYPQLHQNAFVDYFSPENAHNKLDLKCLEESKVKWPDKRAEIINIIDNYEDYEMPVLLIHHLKKDE